jgi:hypothetical protein
MVLTTETRCNEKKTYPPNQHTSNKENWLCSAIPLIKYEYSKIKSAENHNAMPSVKNKYDLP